MSLSKRGDLSTAALGVRYDGNKARFRPFHSRLRQFLYNKSIKFKMALRHAGEFKGLLYVPDQVVTKTPVVGSDGLPELRELKDYEGADEQEKKQKHAYAAQLLYNTVCEQIYHVIQRSVTDKVCDVMVSHNVVEGDGVTLCHRLVEIFQGKGNVSLLALCGKLFRLSMTGPLSDLDSHTAEFNELTTTLRDQKQQLGPQLTSAVCLVGLSSRCQCVKDAVADDDAGLNDVNEIIERVRAHETLKDHQTHTSQSPGSPSAHLVDASARPDASRGAGERKLRCFNCRKVHLGGELKCTQPCRTCKKKGHTRCNCPERKRATSVAVAQPSPAENHIIDTSMTHWGLTAGSTPLLRSKPKLDSGAHWDLFGTCKLRGGSAHHGHHRCRNLSPSHGTVHVGDGVGLTETHSGDIGNLRRVKLINGLSADLVSASKMCDDQDAWILFSKSRACMSGFRQRLCAAGDCCPHCYTQWRTLRS